MQKRVSLSAYVKKRTGVALGASHSMRNMFYRSLGASSFHYFWCYWNPIWGYFLSRYVMKPINSLLPHWLAIVLTFSVCGALHDLAVSLVYLTPFFLITPWFSLMGFTVILTKYFAITYPSFPWLFRASINLLLIAVTFWLTKLLMHFCC